MKFAIIFTILSTIASISSAMEIEKIDLAKDDEAKLDSCILKSELKSVRKGGRFNQSFIATFQDDTEWVVLLGGDGSDRFVGYLYLEDAIEKSGLKNVKAADNRLSIIQGKIHYLSRYVGEERIGHEFFAEMQQLREIGFADMICGANLRKLGDTMYVFDTEKGSFSEEAQKNIEMYRGLHDKVLARLKKASELATT